MHAVACSSHHIARNIVGDDPVGALRDLLGDGMLDDPLGLGGKTDEKLRPLRASTQLGKDVACRDELELGRAIALLELGGGGLDAPVGHCGHEDRGIRDCLKAGKACNAYLINVKRTDRNRVGNFWLDALRFRREVDVTGWSFNALVIFVNDLAVYAVYGGQPVIHEVELERNPLGPLQGWGDWVGAKALP